MIKKCLSRSGLLCILLVFTSNIAQAMATTPGQFSVGPSGAATYSIPIQVPPGTAGMQPNLSLVYNSQTGNGIFGQGWSLDGLPIIHRCPATYEQDGFKGGINYDSNDRLCMNGQRLVAINGVYGADGTEYRTEIESFSKIISYGQAGSGPAWFKVWTKEGQIMEFGNTEDSRVEALNRVDVRVWTNNKVMDTVGNYMTVTYIEKNGKGQYCPSRIDYTSNDLAGHTAQRSIKFESMVRHDVTNSYVSGSKVVNDMLITNIKTYVNEVNVKDYKLSYVSDNDVMRSHIQSVTECDGVGNCLPDKNFFYNKTGEVLSVPIEWGGYVGRPSNHDVMFNYSLSDMNGDGLVDFVYRLSGTKTLKVAVNTGSDFETPVEWGTYPEKMGDDSGKFSHSMSDMNGDGLVDLLYRVDGTNILKVLINTGASFEAAVVWGTYPDRMGDNIQLFKQSMSDMNGDGLVDLAYRKDGTRIIKVMINTGTSFKAPVIWGEYTGPQPESIMKLNYSMSDMNGDGLVDYLFRENYSSTFKVLINTGASFKAAVVWGTYPDRMGDNTPLFKHSMVDMNGDGLVDLAYRKDGTRIIKVMINTGALFEPSVIWGEYTGVQPGSERQLNYSMTDMNGDGIADYLFREKYSKTYKVMLNTGTAFEVPVEWGTYAGTMSSTSDFINYALADMNGDGLTDVLYRNKYINESSRVLFSLTSTPIPSFRMSSITDGLGAQTKITYKSLTDKSVYTKGSTAQYPELDLQVPQYVVSSYAMSDGLDGMYQMDYHYAGLKAHLLGRGSLGFNNTTVIDSRTGIRTITHNRQDFPFIGSAELSETRLADNTLIKRTSSSMASRVLGNSTPTRYFVYATDSVEESFELDGTAVTKVMTSSQYDDYGNPTQIVVDNNDGYIKTTINTYTNNATKWHLGRLTQAKVTSQTPLQGSATRTSAFDYDATTGLLKQEVIEPGNPEFKLTTDHGYDAYGNKISVTVSGAGISTRTTTTNYDPVYHSFPVSVTNAAGHSETRAYEPYFGKRTSLTGPNSLTTTWSYDGFGRVLDETRADGTQTTKTYTYCSTNCPYGSPYYVTTQASGSPSSTMYVDMLGREIKSETEGFTGTKIFKDTEYDTLGRAARVSRPYYEGDTTYWTEYSYDVLGRVLTEINADASRTDIQYNGLATTTINDKNQSTTKIKDSQGQLVESVDTENNTTLYQYDPYGNLITVTDPVGNISSMSYDLRGRKTGMNDPDMGVWTYSYNVLGELVQQTDAKGQTVSMQYDVLGRLVSRTEPEGVSSWEYDTASKGIGKLAKSTSPGGYEKRQAYDALGRPDRTTTYVNGTPYVVQTNYDNLGRVETLSYPTGLQVRNVYTALGYLKEIRNAANNALYWQLDAMSAQGQTTQYTLGNGLTTINNYDVATNRIKDITTGAGSASNIQNLSYGFDTLGNLTSREDRNQTLAETFKYDALNRLTETNFQGLGSKTYQYDSLGNITFKSDVGHYTYGQNNAGPHAVTQTFGTRNNTYSYDANGNQVAGAGRTLTYTSFNKVLSVTKDTTVVSYAYDAERNRIKKTKGADTTVYIGKMYEKVIKGGVLEHKQYISAGKMSFAVLNTKGTSTETRYLHKDHLGSTDVITDELGNVVERQSFDAHGLRRNSNWVDSPIGLTITSIITSRGFTGHEMDDEIGLINMNARMYDPVLGRFLSPDTYVQFPDNAQSYNRYTYVNNNPLSFTDPSGHFLKSLFKGIKKLFKSIKKFIRPIIAAVIGYYTFAYIWAQTWNYVLAGAAAGGVSAGILGQNIFEGIVNGALLSYNSLGKSFSNPITEFKKSIDKIASGLKDAADVVATRVKNLALNHVYTKVAHKLARKAGLSITNFNSILLASSIAGGSRFRIYKNDHSRYDAFNKNGSESFIQVLEGYTYGRFGGGESSILNVPFNVVDTLLVYQGLPSATTRDFLMRGFSNMKVFGFSLGAARVNDLVGKGYAKEGVATALPIGLSGAKNVQVNIGIGDLINGSFIGKAFTPSAKICNVFGHSQVAYGKAC